MSATEEHGLIPGGQDGAGGGAGDDPSPLGVRASPSGGMDGVEGAAALLASLRPSRALGGEDGGQEATQAPVEEDWDAELVEEEEEEEVEEEEEEEGEEEGEEEEEEEQETEEEEEEIEEDTEKEMEGMEEEEEEEEFELDLEDQEEDEYQSEEGDKTEEEEEEETEEEEEEMQMEEDMEEEVEGMEKTEEEEEEEEEEFKLDIEDQEEDVYQSEEGDETAEEVEEDKETEEEDDNGQEGAGVVAGHGASAARSKSLLRDVVHCHAQPRHYTYRVLVDPKTGCVMVRRRCLWPSGPAADAVPPQGQENLGEAGEVWRSEYQAEGTPPCEPREPAEGAASQKAEEPAAAAAEAEFWAGDVLSDTSESSEAGACGPDDGAEADPPEGRELDSPADFKSGNVVHHLVMPKSVSFDTKEESEHQYENADEEKEDGNEKPEEGPKLDMVSAEGSSGEYSWKA